METPQPHKGSVETYEQLSDFIAPDFAFSKQDLWDRFGMLGVFGDYVLSSVQGAVLEIGTGESSIYLGTVAKKYNRKIYHCDISPSKILNPLSVPGYFAEDNEYLEENFETMQNKRCVLYAGPSDKMFEKINIEPLALSFIDGDHIYEQVKKDFYNILPLTVDNGYIILHDTYPPTEEYIDENRCGTVYKFRQEIEKHREIDCITLTRGCAIGVGLTICRKKPKERPYYNE